MGTTVNVSSTPELPIFLNLKFSYSAAVMPMDTKIFRRTKRTVLRYLRWKRLILRSLAGGTACGITVAVMLLALYAYTHRTKSWDNKAVRAARENPELTMNFNVQPNARIPVFSADLENTTDEDISLPRSTLIFQESRRAHALHGSILKLKEDYVLPARHVMRIVLDSNFACPTATNDAQHCFELFFKGDDSLILLDRSSRLEIRVPIIYSEIGRKPSQ